MDRAEAIKKFEKQLTSAQAVLDYGFGTRPNESNRLYVERKEMAKIALAALREQEQREQGCEACNDTNTDILAVTVDGYAWLPKWATKFCPVCGRKLKEGADHED